MNMLSIYSFYATSGTSKSMISVVKMLPFFCESFFITWISLITVLSANESPLSIMTYLMATSFRLKILRALNTMPY